MPYITEELWQQLPGAGKDLLHPAYQHAEPTIMLAAYPEVQADLIDEDAEWEMQAVIDLISRVRNIRSEMNIKPSEPVPVLIGAPDEKLRAVFSANTNQISRLVRASEVSISEQAGSAAGFGAGGVGWRRGSGCAAGGFDRFRAGAAAAE